MAHKKILEPTLNVGARVAGAMAAVGHNQQIKILVRFDQSVREAKRVFWRDVVIQFADDEK